jgi:integrase
MNNMTPIAFHFFADEIVCLYTGPQKRPKTLAKVCQVLAEIAPACATTADLTPAAVARWLADHPARKATTRRNLLATLRALCGYGQFRGYLTSPFEYRGLAGWIPADELVTEPFGRHRTGEEIARVLGQADGEALGGPWHARRLRALIYTLAFTGMHDGEARGLRVADVDLPGRMILISSHARRRLKTGARAARVPIAGPLADVLADWVPETGCEWLFPGSRRSGPWTGGPPGYRPLDRVRQLGERAAVAGLTIKAFRHSFATLAEGWGLGELELQRVLRHSRPTTQIHYRHHDAEILRGAAAKVRYPDPSPPLPAVGTPPPTAQAG